MSVIVCLYSKYSEKCRSFLEYVSTTPLDMKMLCVDNEKVRELLEQDDPRYHIRMVPCLLIFQMNGVMEKKEGFESFEYVQNVLKQLQVIPTTTESKMTMIPVTEKFIQDTPMEKMERFGPQPPKPHPSIPFPPSAFDQPPTNDASVMSSSPASTIPTDNQELPTEALYVSKKKENILSLAASMAKQRESEDEQMHPNPYAKAQEAQEAIMTQQRN